MHVIREHFWPTPITTSRLVVRGVGVREIMPPCVLDRPSGWPFYLLVFFYDPVLCDTPTGRRMIEPGTLVVWKPDSPQYFGNTSRRWNHSWFSAGGPVMEAAMKRSKLPCDVPLRPAESDFVDPGLLEIHGELRETERIDPPILENLAVNLIRRIARACAPGSGGRNVPPHLAAVKRHVDAAFSDPSLCLQLLAERAGLSVSQLCLSYKRHYGTTLMACVRDRRMHFAARLLHDTHLKVSDVARSSGYADVYHFSKAFKQFFGKTPGRFRVAG